MLNAIQRLTLNIQHSTFLFRTSNLEPGHVSLRVESRQVLCLPLHRCMDPISSTRMIEEKPLLDRTGTHLAILPQMNGRLCEAIRLPARVEAVHVGFEFLRAD